MTQLIAAPIKKVEAAKYRRSFRHPFITASLSLNERVGIYLKITFEDGLIRYGEAAPLAGLSHESLGDIEKIWGQQSWLDTYRETPEKLPSSLVMAIDSCLLDFPRVENKALKLNAVIAEGADYVAMCRQGFRTLKFKTSPASLDATVEKIKKVREQFGFSIQIRVDANQSFALSEMPRLAQALAPLNLEYLEDPFAELPITWNEHSSIPLAWDYEQKGPGINAILGKKGFDYFILKPSICGGLLAAAKLKDKIHAEGKKVILTSALETEIGLRAILGLAFSFKMQDAAYGLSTTNLFSDPFFTLSPEQGEMPEINSPLHQWLNSLAWESV